MPAAHPALTFSFDDTACEIHQTSLNHGLEGFEIRVTEGDFSLALHTTNGADLRANAAATLEALVVKPSAWVADRVAYVFTLAARKVAPLAAELARA